MNKHSDIDRKVNETLESLEGIQKAEPTPFFYTRVRARLERGERNVWETLGGFLARPGVAIAGLVLVLGLNAFLLIDKNTATSSEPEIGQINFEEEEENILTASNTFDYENLEP